MSLIRCQECNKKISDKAPHCPYCGIDTSLFEKESTGTDKKDSVKNNVAKLYFIPLALAILLFVSACDLPYGFYTFARIAVFFGSAIFMIWYFSITDSFSVICCLSILIAIIWNPFIPIYMSKDAWVSFDIIAAIIEIIMFIFGIIKSK